mgnify:FL=1
MTDEDWLEILRLIRVELRQVGLGSIAELNDLDDDTFEGRRSYGARNLAVLMLEALDRHLSVHSSETVDTAMAMIAEAVVDEPPRTAILFNAGDDIGIERVEAEERLVGDQRIPAAREDLRRLIGLLLEVDGHGGDDEAGFK